MYERCENTPQEFPDKQMFRAITERYEQKPKRTLQWRSSQILVYLPFRLSRSVTFQLNSCAMISKTRKLACEELRTFTSWFFWLIIYSPKLEINSLQRSTQEMLDSGVIYSRGLVIHWSRGPVFERYHNNLVHLNCKLPDADALAFRDAYISSHLMLFRI